MTHYEVGVRNYHVHDVPCGMHGVRFGIHGAPFGIHGTPFGFPARSIPTDITLCNVLFLLLARSIHAMFLPHTVRICVVMRLLI